ncbi:hypothetical protein TNCV_3472351 [Trichonephila clavipes]|nr:hypothetical protein TNCV_3472351 [Trichonephila clavipes]
MPSALFRFGTYERLPITPVFENSDCYRCLSCCTTSTQHQRVLSDFHKRGFSCPALIFNARWQPGGGDARPVQFVTMIGPSQIKRRCDVFCPFTCDKAPRTPRRRMSSVYKSSNLR